VIGGYVEFRSQRVKPPSWIKSLIYLSIPGHSASIRYGIPLRRSPGRHFWLSAIMAARFLASAFAGGPALLIILALIVRKLTKFDPGREPIQALGR